MTLKVNLLNWVSESTKLHFNWKLLMEKTTILSQIRKAPVKTSNWINVNLFLKSLTILNVIYSGDGTVTTTFEPTPPMSTYLLAFTISDFSSEKLDSRPIHITHSRPEAIERTKFALSNSQKALAELEKYLIANYTLKKLSSVALPEFGTAMGKGLVK